MNVSRFKHLMILVDKSAIEGVALNAGTSLHYFTDIPFHLMERPVVLVACLQDSPVLIIPRLEQAKIKMSSGKRWGLNSPHALSCSTMAWSISLKPVLWKW